jgi:predicted CXXCH cytochrome family protein
MLLLLALVANAADAGSIVTTAHNLSTTGPGPVRSTSETQVCIFCHTPHNSNPSGPLWNHQLPSGVNYLKYASPTLDAYSGQAAAPDPNGASRLCLSCHDGTVALGAVGNSIIPLSGGATVMAAGDPGFLGTDLSRTHPISFTVSDQLIATNNAKDAPLNDLAAMRADRQVHLDGADRVQCTACHDPHNDDNFASSGVHFYNKPGRAETCMVCHAQVPADQGPHVVRSALRVAPGPVVAGVVSTGPRAPPHQNPDTLPLGCMSCHAGHAPAEGARSLLFARDESACYRCHGPGKVEEVHTGRLSDRAQPVDVQAQFLKPSHHPVEWPGEHSSAERFPETDSNTRRHVKCLDCHDAHGGPPQEPHDLTGMRVRPSTTRRFASEAEMCFVCHGPAANRPARQPDAQRQFTATSFHPVLSPGRGAFVPSLIQPLTLASVVSCTDCHGNEEGSGSSGPHGSIYPPLLVRQYATDDNQPESPARYDLCYRCHDRSSILGDRSFPQHRKHVAELRAPCTACHSAHGSDEPHLVRFDPAIVQPNKRGQFGFLPQGPGGQCFLSCHGADHDPAAYCGPGIPCPSRPAQARKADAPQLRGAPAPQSIFPGWPTP